MKRHLAIYEKNFYNRTTHGHIIKYNNGFVSAGVLANPDIHLNQANRILQYSVGSNYNGTKLIEITNSNMTLKEAEGLIRCLQTAVSHLKDVLLEENKK